MTTKEKIAVMQAYEDGKQIQKRNYKGDWVDCDEPIWDWSDFEYRVKPEPPKPEYVPYETGAEFMQDVLKHKGWVMIKEKNEEDCCYYPIGAFCTYDKSVDVISNNPPEDWDTPFGTLLAGFVWADDGTPCGKLKGCNK